MLYRIFHVCEKQKAFPSAGNADGIRKALVSRRATCSEGFVSASASVRAAVS